MNGPPDYKRFAILYVDDEEKSLKSFARAFGDDFRIFTAPTAQEGFKIFQEHKDDIGILMTDQRMPGEKGVWLLEQVRHLRPQVIRILVTGYSDMEAVVAAVNTGAIYRFVTKPWDPTQLQATLKHALEFFMLGLERDQLLKEKTVVLHQMMVADRVLGLGLLAAGLSHHIRNSLVAVKTFLDLAPLKLEEENLDLNALRNPDFWKDYHQNAQGQVEKINDLLKDLWLASERPPFHFTDKIRLDELVAKVIDQMKPGLTAAGLEVINDIPDALPSLMVDLAKFTRLIELLLKDEIASLPKGSRITFTARATPDSAIHHREILMEMHDNGPGLSEEALRVMFDPFVVRTDSPQEYGISLMACYFIVHHHGGKIEARKADPHGTIFSLRLLTDPNQSPPIEENTALLRKVVRHSGLWEKMLASE